MAFELKPNRSFHTYLDREVLPYRRIVGIGGEVETRVRETVSTTTRLTYTFTPHFHPYVAELVRDLVQRSVDGLQAADTDYRTSVKLSSQTVAKLADGNNVTILPNDVVSLADESTLQSGGKRLLLVSHRILDETTRESVRLADGATVRLQQKTVVRLADRRDVSLTADVAGTLVGDGPRPRLFAELFSATSYQPTAHVAAPFPVKELDFSIGGAYAHYNWELFFHVPITVAIHLSRNGRYSEAQRWMHYIFDPTDDSSGPTPERFWKVKPFRSTEVQLIADVLLNLSTGSDPQLRQQTIESIGEWKAAPFRPHVVARYRQSAYMLKTVMAYLDNLVAWGDSLFAQDTIESINEATQLYVLAANILGPRPQVVPKKGSIRPQTYDNLKRDLDAFGNVLRELETDIPLDATPHPTAAAPADSLSAVRSLGNTLYFCIPRNERLMGYWDTVADRLFKIRNSLNLQGVFRQLALFDPPIDPALLARAAAAGVDIASVIAGATQPLPLVRSQFLLQKASEACQEVKSLGGAVLSAVEKEDGEALALLRAKHERVMLGLGETVRYQQWQESIESREALERSLVASIERYRYYERLLGKSDDDIEVPELDAIDKETLTSMRFRSNEPEMPLRDIEVDISAALDALTGGRKLSSHEAQELQLMGQARLVQDVVAALELTGGALSMLPNFAAEAEPLGVGASVTYGGANLSQMFSLFARAAQLGAERLMYDASGAARIGGYARREQEWALASNNVAGEISQTYKQLRAAQIRESIAKREWENHKQQIKQSEEVERFLAGERDGKKTNRSFYSWLKRETKALHSQAFQFAFELARKAERAVQHELGDPALRFLEMQYLAGHEGLLAGEKLHLDLKRMEAAYHDRNQREYELTRHVSLLQLDPRALLALRQTGRCTFVVPEELFDLDCPGHYFRRIRNVAVSVPCVAGPFTSVNCTLTLQKSSIRRKPLLRDGVYLRDGADDDRFSDHFGSVQSIVTSSGQSDAGLFDANLRDERYLPFEGTGAVSEWELRLPAELRQFDYETIADVILHLRYTAREGGELLRGAAVAALKERIAAAEASGSVRLISVRHEFPTEWARFTRADLTAGAAPLTLQLREEHYPFWSRDKKPRVLRDVHLFAKTDKDPVVVSNKATAADKKDNLTKNIPLGGLRTGKLDKVAKPGATDPLAIFLDDNTMKELWIALTWVPGV